MPTRSEIRNVGARSVVDPRATVVIVDSDVDARETLGNLLHAEGFFVQIYGSAEEFLKSCKECHPVCVILEGCLPGLDGLQLQQVINALWPPVSIIFVASAATISMSVHAIKAGAVDFLMKPCRKDCVITAVRYAADRCRKLRVIEAELAMLRDRYALLTPREKVVLPLIASGAANWEAASQLGISEVTVKVHRANLMRKMRADSLAGLIRMIFQLQIPIRLDGRAAVERESRRRLGSEHSLHFDRASYSPAKTEMITASPS